MSAEFKKNALDLLIKAKQTASEIKGKALDEYDKSGAKVEVEKRLRDAKSFLDENGITEKAEVGIKKVQELSEIASDNLDKVSGKKILELVEARLSIQTQYNDILASKLEEALDRIRALEEKLSGEK
jgi:hypothetical protein